MPYEDYFQQPECNISEELQKLFGSQVDDLHKGFCALETIESHVLRYLDIRLEVAIFLLDCFDLVEVSIQPSMVPSQKAEWAWRCYNRYFDLLTKIILVAHKNFEAGAEELSGQFEFLITKFHYEWERRKVVLEKGGMSPFKKAVRPIRHLMEL